MRGILGINTELERVAGRHRNAPIGNRHGLTGCNTQLLAHKIGTRDLLGHRMFHLDAGIHLHKVEATILIEEKLDGTGIDVADFAHGGNGDLAHLGALLIGKRRARSLLNKLLMTALNGAVALAKGSSMTKRIGQNLNLNVARA